MIESHDYEIELVGKGVRSGILSAEGDGLPSLHVASPPEFGGPEGVWSPEHLYVASISSCLMTTFRAIAESSNLEVLEYSDSASGHMVRGDDRLYSISEVTLRPRVVIAEGEDVEKAERLLRKAEGVCLISRSVKTKVSMEGHVLVKHRVGGRAEA